MKKLLKIIAIVLIVALVAALGYVAYVFIAWHRIDDNQALTPRPGEAAAAAATTGQRYTIASWNLGFGAYSADFTFFMDGGKESWARSADAVRQNIGGAMDVLKALDPDFAFLQEVDDDSTRSHHIDEAALVYAALPDYSSVFARNYDSPFLFYPFTQPHGASKSGIITLSSVDITSSIRRSLPIETGLTRFLDLDRCYSVSRVPVDNGKELVLYNLHLSAYTSDGTIATKQLEMLLEDMAGEYAKGNYVIAGGDFNKDLPGNSPELFGVSGDAYTWAQAFPTQLIPEGFSLAPSWQTDAPVPSCRNCDIEYIPGKTFVVTVDGFIVSANINPISCRILDEGFACTDHNPAVMEFELIEPWEFIGLEEIDA